MRTGNYKEGTLVYDRDPREIHQPIIDPERYELTFSPDPNYCRILEYYCPGCGTQIETEYLPPGHPPRRRGGRRDAKVATPETVSAYSSLANVAGHFEWTLALRDEDMVEVPAGEPSIALVPEDHWTRGADLLVADVLLARIPPTASPECVLDQRARLR